MVDIIFPENNEVLSRKGKVWLQSGGLDLSPSSFSSPMWPWQVSSPIWLWANSSEKLKNHLSLKVVVKLKQSNKSAWNIKGTYSLKPNPCSLYRYRDMFLIHFHVSSCILLNQITMTQHKISPYFLILYMQS